MTPAHKDRRNPYLVLGLPYGASKKEVRKGFAKRARDIKSGKFTVYRNEDLNWAFVSFKLEIGDNVYDCEVAANAADGDECVIVQNGGDSDTQWESDEIVFIDEYNTDICSSQCTVEITVQYNGQVLSGTPSVNVA